MPIRTRRRRLPWFAPLVLVIALPACLAGALLLLARPLPPRDDARVVPVVRATVSESVGVRGVVAPRWSAPVAFAADGVVATVAVREGDTVRAGQVLVTLDATATRPRLDAARAGLDAADRDLAAVLALRPPDPAATPAGVARARAARDAAATELATAQQADDATTVRAPADTPPSATVVDVPARVGDPVRAADAITGRAVDLADLGVLGADLQVGAPDLPRVAPGQRVDLRIDGAPAPAVGTVASLDPTPADGGAYRVAVSLPPPSALPTLRVGQAVDAHIVVARIRGVLVVPPAALRPVPGRTDRATVLVRRPAGDRTVDVEVGVDTGLADAVSVEIRKGVRPGDLVLVPGRGTT